MMICPVCNGRGKVLETRTLTGGVYRRHRCPRDHTFWTHETAVTGTPAELHAHQMADMKQRMAAHAARPRPRTAGHDLAAAWPTNLLGD